MKMAIPAYFSPTDFPTLWTKLQSSGGPVSIAVINPSSGPGPRQDPDYVNTVNNTKAAGVRVLGYVSTRRGARSRSDVESDIDKYYNWYNNIDGIFFDEASTSTGTTELAYYLDIYNYVKTKSGTKTVVINPGTQTAEAYMTRCDILMNWESDYVTYRDMFTLPPWVVNYSPSRFWHLVHDAPDEDAMRDAVQLGKRRGTYHIYVTPDVMDNQWDTLPPDPYWSAELRALSSPAPEIQVHPDRLEFSLIDTSSPQFIPSVYKRVNLRSTFVDRVTVTVEDATVDIAQTDFGGGSGEFSNFSGQTTIRYNGSLTFWVKFAGRSGNRPGSVSGSLRVRWDSPLYGVSGQQTIELLGSLSGPLVV